MATTHTSHRARRLHMRRWAVFSAAALVLSTLLAFFGARVASAVGDLTVRVYTDSNRNGQYDSGEPAVSSVPVSVFNTDNNLLYSVNTNASGLAIFPNTPNGDYRVEVTNPNNGLPNGTVVSLPGPTTPGQDNALVFFVNINNAPVQRDVGLRSLDASGIDAGAPAGFRTIVVRAWDDQDANGIQDAGEPGLSGLTLGLYTPSNVLVATATAGPDGTYRFVDNVPAGVSNYTIRVTGGISAGRVLTTQNANFDSEDRRDSDAQLVAGEPRITVPNAARGVNDDSLDVGFARGAVSGFVWRDLDQNGLRDPGEPFINGVTVELRDSSDNLIDTQTTRSILNDPANRAGFFEFVSVPLTATYRVRIPNDEFNAATDPLYGHATPLNNPALPPAIGDRGLINGATDGPAVIGAGDYLQTPNFTLDATNRRNETSNFGLYAGTVGDFVWHDVNRNGSVDPLETTLGLSNALVFVDLDSDCQVDTGEPQTTTDLNGNYRFDNLPLGITYTVVLAASNFAPGGALEGLGYTTGAPCGSTEGVVITTTLLTASQPTDFTVDFGIVRAEIGNFVWEDDNGNGIFDLSETGVQSVTVQLYGAGTDSTFFTSDDVTVGLSQTTNASGIYTITDILSGTYYATFDLSALPLAYVASIVTPTGWLSVDPPASSSDDVNDVRALVSGRVWRTPTFTIARGSQNPGVDAAVYRPASLSGRVFFDQNGNNQDETSPEPGLANFTVNLRRASDDAVVTTTTTLADGSYVFSSVAPLTYVVEIVRPDPSNWSFVAPDNPSAGDPLASDVNATTGRTGVLTVTSGITVTDVDAGLRGNNTVQGYVFFDRDGSFTQTANDQALNGATATLTVTVATLNLTTTYTLTATTIGADPNYSFAGLPGGASGVTYTLAFDPPDGTYTASLADVGGNDALDSDGPFITVTGATVGVSNTLDYDQGYWRPVTVRARIFDEITALPPNNVYNSGDTGITTATVTITTTNGTVTPLGSSGIDSTGVVTFTLPPTTTTYWLNVPTPAGFTPSPGNTGALEVNTPSPLLADDTAPSPTTEFQFGYFRAATVTGVVRFDRDADNDLFADNEPGMQGVTVTLRLGGSDVLTTTTDATGAYTFTNVAPANGYSVRVINPDATNFLLATPTGGDNDLQTLVGNDADTAPFNVAPGATVSGSSDAAVRGRSTVTGAVWEDLNGNGVRDGGEGVGALPGVTVNLTVTVNLPGLLSTQIVTMTTTDASGAYTVTNLPGWASASSEVSFTLRFATPTGWYETLADVGPQPATDDSDGVGTGVDQLDNQGLQRNTTETRDRGYYRPAVIQVQVFEEMTSPINNAYAAGDAPVPGATVALTPNVTLGGPFGPDSTGIISYTVAPTTTAYTVGVTPPAGYVASPGNTGTATATAPLTSGQSITPLPFGYYRNGIISGTVWFDANGNGLFDGGEPTVAGVTVTLTLDPDATVNGNETPIGTFTTGDNGIYQFTAITPTGALTSGTLYRVQFALPGGYAFTTQGAPVTTDNNSDARTVDGYTDRFTVGSNETVTYVDAGAVGNLSLSGTTWEDIDADGVFDAGESPLSGVTLTLTVTTSINSTNPVVTYTVTSGAGSPNFTFNQLPAGNYQLSVTGRPLGYLLSTTGTLSGTLPATGQNFGLYRTASVGDRVWLDVNGNGAYEAGVDAGVPGIIVRLRDAATDTVISTTTTLASGDVGFYGFENVIPGSYVVEFVVPTGFQTVNNGAGSLSVDNDNDAQNNGRTASFTLASSQISTTVDAGLIGSGSIAGIAWVDENFNDVRDSGETQRIAGVAVTLTITPTGLGTPLTFNAVTATNGSYAFGNLPPGTFVLTFTKPAGYFDIATRVGSDPTIDSDAPAATGTLGAGQSITTLDAGYRTQTRVFLPLIAVPVTPPDLVVEEFTVTPAKTSYAAGEPVLITVKVKNVGGSPTTIGFWVDLYINPSVAPTTPNVRWNDVCGISPCYGIAWYVNQSLAPGQSITLTSAPGQFAGPQSVWPGSFAGGTNTLYVYVDSYNPPVPTGAVVESNETNNRAQITGFVVTGASLSNDAGPGTPSSAPDAPVALPPRQLPEPVER